MSASAVGCVRTPSALRKNRKPKTIKSWRGGVQGTRRHAITPDAGPGSSADTTAANVGTISLATQIAQVKDGDLLLLHITGAGDFDEETNEPLLARAWFFEAVRDATFTKVAGGDAGDTSTVIGLCRGVTTQLTFHDDSKTLTLSAASRDSAPNLATRAWVLANFPEWSSLLKGLCSNGTYPRSAADVLAPLTAGQGQGSDAPKIIVSSVEKVTDYAELTTEILTNPGYWCDGTPANCFETDPKKQATLNAGELLALLVGNRGVVLTQLWAGWVEPGNQQPIDAPFALRALRECCLDGKVVVLAAPIAGAPLEKGLTAIIASSESPWMERAILLQSFGAQAALVAGSPYYQTLVGTILGYDRRNVEAHVASIGGALTPQIVRAVATDLDEVSNVAGSIPWRDAFFPSVKPGRVGTGSETTETGTERGMFFFEDVDGADEENKKLGGRRKKKKKPSSTASLENVESMFGKKGR